MMRFLISHRMVITLCQDIMRYCLKESARIKLAQHSSRQLLRDYNKPLAIIATTTLDATCFSAQHFVEISLGDLFEI